MEYAMFRKPTIIFIIVSMLVLPCMAGAVEVAPRISDREIIESLTEIKQRQQGFSEKLDQNRDSLNQRMDDMMKNIDKRFESIDKRLESIDKRFESIDKRLESIDKRFESIDKRFESIDKRFESLEQRLESMVNITIAMFGSVMALIIALIGYTIWDRRTAVKPLQEKIVSVEKATRQMGNELDMEHPSGSLLERLVAAFRELAKTDEKVAEVLRSFSLL